MAPLVRILVLLVALAAPATAAGAVPFGFHGVDYDREVAWAPPAVQAGMWKAMRGSGVQSARVIFDWSEAQRTPGAPPSWHETDPLVLNAAAQGIEPLPVVLYAPRWARALPGEKQSAPANPDDYAAYLTQLVARYGPGGTFWAEHPELPARPIRTWQIWNEPDMPYQWVPRRNWERAYGRLLLAARDALGAADPGAKVVAAAVTNFSWRSLRALYDRGGIRGAFDAAALNAYTREPGNLVEIIRRARKVMDARGDREVPIYVTEFGASASQGRITVGRDRDHLQTTDRKLAKLVLRAYDALAANRKRLRVERAYWYTWASTYDRRGDIFDFSGLVRFREGDDGFSSRQALGAYRKSARKLQGVSRR